MNRCALLYDRQTHRENNDGIYMKIDSPEFFAIEERTLDTSFPNFVTNAAQIVTICSQANTDLLKFLTIMCNQFRTPECTQ